MATGTCRFYGVKNGQKRDHRAKETVGKAKVIKKHCQYSPILEKGPSGNLSARIIMQPGFRKGLFSL
jgi:hypothetical protein